MPTPSSLSPTIKEHVPLAPYTTLRIGGPARFFCDISSEAALLEAVQFARERSLRVFVLGGGSNLLVGDKGFDGLVLHLTLSAPVQTTSTAEHVDCIAPAGLDWDAFVFQICQQGVCGVECLAGIPGLVGGTPVQNVGAYGQEVADTIHSVRALDLETLTFVDLPRKACAFGYRRSIFNSTYPNRYIVSAVEFRFSKSATPNITYADLKSHFASTPTPPTPLDVYHAVREIRSRKGMLLVEGEPDCRSAGSFFKNPIVPATILNYIADSLNLDPAAVPNWPTPDGKLKLPAAWLLERAGFHRGFALGEAGISSRHTLALINRGHATATDITALRDRIQQEIKAKFGIQLEQEPVELKS